jgi:uncharacterized protein (TIGR04255 family)
MPSYKNSPITEALIDIQVKVPEKTELDLLKKIQEKVKKEYPEFKIKTEFKASFKVQPNQSDFATETSGKPIGYMFSSSNLKKMIQATLYGYTFNLIQDYKDWDSFRKDAQAGWDIYYQDVKPIQITRIGLRYINSINITPALIDFKDYILTTPEIAHSLPQGMSDFFMRLVIPDSNQNTAIITQTIDRSKIVKNTLPLIFDIDVFRNINLESNNMEIWSIVDSLHTYALDIFEKSLTNRTKQLFN